MSPDDQAQHALGGLVCDRFAHAMTLQETIADLTLDAMKLGIETEEAEKLIAQFYNTCLTRQTDSEVIARLARMDPLSYERNLTTEAKRLKVRKSVLDGEVGMLRKQGETQKSAAPKWAAPTMIADAPVDGAELLGDLRSTIERFVMLAPAHALVAALWILFTWRFEHFAETNPFLRIVSPLPGCGKTTLLKVLKYLCRSGWMVARVTQSAFVRTMQIERRTLLLDEGDAFLHENEVMRNVLNGASDPDDATNSMCVKFGDDWTPADFNYFVPIAIASIGKLRKMETVEDRSISINLKRATPSELKALAKGRRRELKAALEPIAARCARWAQDNAPALGDGRPALPDDLSGREQDKWEPLISVADLCGVGVEARNVALSAAAERPNDDKPVGVMLLADMQTIFGEEDTDRAPSKVLCERLAAIEGRPWMEFGKARKPISQNQLARLLKLFAVAPHTIRLPDGSTPKGYETKDFTDAWERYLDSDPSRHNATTAAGVEQSSDFQSATDPACGGSKNATFSNGENECGTVADQYANNGAEQEMSAARERFEL